jgi:energy-coupling factor transporter transmembrane protein EcfT
MSQRDSGILEAMIVAATHIVLSFLILIFVHETWLSASLLGLVSLFVFTLAKLTERYRRRSQVRIVRAVIALFPGAEGLLITSPIPTRDRGIGNTLNVTDSAQFAVLLIQPDGCIIATVDGRVVQRIPLDEMSAVRLTSGYLSGVEISAVEIVGAVPENNITFAPAEAVPAFYNASSSLSRLVVRLDTEVRIARAAKERLPDARH